MNTHPKSSVRQFACILTLITVVLSGCSTMTAREKNTAIGAGVGAIAGSILTGGSTFGTLGGAALGGVIGHEIGGHRKKH